MRSLNRVVLIGNLGKDPEIRTLEGGIKVAQFSVATSERYRDKDGNWQDGQTEWHNIVAWRNLAERAERELRKGKSVYVEGKINYRSWQDKDGNTRYNTDILARSFRTFERIESQSGGNRPFPSLTDAPTPFADNQPKATPQPVAAAQPKPVAAVKPTPKPVVEDEADDLPF